MPIECYIDISLNSSLSSVAYHLYETTKNQWFPLPTPFNCISDIKIKVLNSTESIQNVLNFYIF